MKTSVAAWVVGCVGALALCGCGGSQPSSAESAGTAPQAAQAPQAETENANPPVAAIAAPSMSLDGVDLDVEALDAAKEELEPAKDSPEFVLREIVQLKLEAPPKTEDIDQLRAARKARNDKIIELATQVIAKTHRDAERERVFTAAVHHLIEARMQLALQGDPESVDAMYDDAASLWQRDRTSKAAADAAFALVNLAYQNARNTAPKDLKWLQEFARQASQFATNFPEEATRSVPMLFAAARSCELHGLLAEATEAYTLLQTKFPQAPQAERVAGVLRRLQLNGEPVELSGPTLDGKFVALDDLAGKPVVVVFWSAAAKPFQEDVPKLLELQQKFAKYGVTLLGVCVDTDEAAARKFVEDNKLPGPQIFFTEEGKQGWNNPLVSYYGVLDVGYWVIDQQGRAVTTNVKAADLEQQLLPLLKRGASRKTSTPRP
jgi:peroxiredoxin